MQHDNNNNADVIDSNDVVVSPSSLDTQRPSVAAAGHSDVLAAPTRDVSDVTDTAAASVVTERRRRVCEPAEYEALKHTLLTYHCARIGETNCFTRASSESPKLLYSCLTAAHFLFDSWQ